MRHTLKPFFSFLICGVLSVNALGSVIHLGPGISATGDPILMRAELTISGDNLTIDLSNLSPVASNSPDDILSSYYFDIVNGGGSRPTLTYTSASGDVYLTDKVAPDTLQTVGAVLLAANPNDDAWAFKAMDESLTPFMGFGLGTVGNNGLSPNNFNGSIVDGMDYSLISGDVSTQSLHNRILVRNSATFNFSGITGFTEDDISANFVFGLGTAPDSTIVPEPTSLGLMLIGCFALLFTRRKQ